jgi:hypothetical protein
MPSVKNGVQYKYTLESQMWGLIANTCVGWLFTFMKNLLLPVLKNKLKWFKFQFWFHTQVKPIRIEFHKNKQTWFGNLTRANKNTSLSWGIFSIYFG